MIIYICATDFLYHLAVAEALFGLGSTFGSGADSAILYESLDRTGRKNDYTRVEGRAASLSFAGQAIGCVASNWLYVIDPDLPFRVQCGLYAGRHSCPVASPRTPT